MELRKRKELEMYQEIYSTRQNFVDPNIREGLLAESENYFIQKMKEICPGKRVLEIGCGEGKHSILAAQFGASEVLGVDVSEAAINIARQKGNGISTLRFEVMDIENLDIKDGSFDVVVDHESLSSVRSEVAFSEAHRVLGKDGLFLGIECLGNNCIFNLNRYIGYLRGRRTKWAISNILRYQQIPPKGFDLSALKAFHLLKVIFFCLSARRKNSSFVEILDHKLLALFPSLGFKAIFMLKKVSLSSP